MTITTAQLDAIEALRVFQDKFPGYMKLIAGDVGEPEQRIEDARHMCAETALLLVKIAATADADMLGNCVTESQEFETQLHDILADYFGSVAQEQAELRAIQEEEEYERQPRRVW
jgi:hypothetical protein